MSVKKRQPEECGPYIRKPWERHRLITEFEGETKTDHSFGNETNVNKIIERFSRTGIMPADQGRQAQYADVTHLQKDLTELIQDGRDAAKRVAEAQAELKNAKREQEQSEKQLLETRIQELEALQSTSLGDTINPS
ncbi:internal scaffolding protein [Microviridae sp.]|nr:internal scaffolding protein [Microviridae sp.]